MRGMCARYDSVLDAARLKQFFGIRGLREIVGAKPEVFPGYAAPFIRRSADGTGDGDAARELALGAFGLLPHWAKDEKLTKSTYNARSETVAAKPAFRDAWRRAQHCIVPAEAIWEPDWRSGRCQWTRIARRDGAPLGLAGLYSTWQRPGGGLLESYTLLTINADAHPFMSNYHMPHDEKRMVVALGEDQYDAWLDAPAQGSMEFLRPWPAQDFHAQGELGAAQLLL
jgi:putative SOS response-associated peptidase YedK